MKLFPPDSDFKIYQEGFGTDDFLNRKEAGQRLSDLLERVEDPIVVALDGPWGSGKSHFLKRWVGAHGIENGGVATTVYFDAFASDFLDDPLIALTGAIGDRLPDGKERDRWTVAKKAAVKLARPLFRIGLAVATAGVTELVVPVVDAAVEAGAREAEAATEAFWKREDGRKAAMQQFQGILTQLTQSSTDKGNGNPIIIVIDELDRCRPDYALAVLEVVKHFFSVPRVHFVLGINMNALEHMVRARYGVGVNAADYLKRFISLSMRLPEHVDKSNSTRVQYKYFENIATSMGIGQNLSREVLSQLKISGRSADISLRDVERILTRLVLLPKREEFERFLYGWQTLIVSIIFLQVMREDLYKAAFNGTLHIDAIDDFYGIDTSMIIRSSDAGNYNHQAYILRGLWLYVISGGSEPKEHNDQFSKAFNGFGTDYPKTILPQIETDFFGLFEVVD